MEENCFCFQIHAKITGLHVGDEVNAHFHSQGSSSGCGMLSWEMG